MSNAPQVLVCGGGPAGLVAALSLAQSGIAVRVIDKSLEFQKGTRGPALAPRSLELLDLLGVLPDVLEGAKSVPPRTQYKDGKPFRTWELIKKEDPSPAVPYPQPVLHSQSNTGAILRKHLEKYNVQVELGLEIVSFTQDANSVTAQLLRTTSTGGQTNETVTVPYLLGMDGGKGVTRKLLDIPFAGDTFSQEVITGDAVIRGLDREHWHIFGEGPRRAFNVLPIGDSSAETFNIVIGGATVDCGKLYDAGLEGLKVFVDEITAGSEPKVELVDLTWFSLFRPSFRCAETFSVGRVFIGGDNAHVHSPMGGQGLNSSIQDAHNVAWKIAHVLKGYSPPSLLDSYSEERIPVIKAMLGITQGLHKEASDANVKVTSDDGRRSVKPSSDTAAAPLTSAPNPVATASATAAAPAAERERGGRGEGGRGGGRGEGEPKQRSDLIKMLGVNYRWSTFVIDERDLARQAENGDAAKLSAYGFEDPQAVRAGDRAPDSPVRLGEAGEETTLFKLFSPAKHTALVFASEGTEGVKSIVDVLGAVPAGAMDTYVVSASSVTVNGAKALVDYTGAAQEAYGIGKLALGTKPAVVIVRPDSVIGAFVFAEEGVRKYVKNVFA